MTEDKTFQLSQPPQQKRSRRWKRSKRAFGSYGLNVMSCNPLFSKSRGWAARWRHDCEELASDPAPLQAGVRETLATGDLEALTQLRSSADRLAVVTEQLAALLGASGLAEEVERQRDQVNTLRETVRELTEHAAGASRQAEEAKTLAAAATRAIAGVTRERFASLQPLVDDIFARLAPHPAFTAMGFEMGVSYRSGIADPFVKDPESGV